MKRLSSIALVFLAFATQGHAQQHRIINYPVEAIVDSAQLPRVEFDKRYPGIDITRFGLMDEGWYVRYTHELLMLVYGPIENLEYARKQKALLADIRLKLVLQNPKLSASEVDIIEFKFDG